MQNYSLLLFQQKFLITILPFSMIGNPGEYLVKDHSLVKDFSL